MVGSGFYWNLASVMKIYLRNVTYAFNLHTYTTNNMQLDFRTIIQNEAVPTGAWLNPAGYVPDPLVDLSRNFVLLYPGAVNPLV